MPSSLPIGPLQAAVAERLPRYLAELERLVNLDCGSYTADGVNEVAAFCAAALGELGANVARIPHLPHDGMPQLGDLVVGRLKGEGPQLLLIGHMDTVFESGTATERPYTVRGSRAHGPGVSDMKGGLLAGLHAIAALHALDIRPAITFVCNPDEEIGSPFSTPVIRNLASDREIALVLECARANGDIVSARKGIADARATFHGRAAHAGIEPEKGRSAVLAAAHATIALHALNGRWPTATVNVGTLRGGTRPNVVAAEARLEIDVRAARSDEFEHVWSAVEAVVDAPALDGVSATLERTAFHPPMERGAGTGRLVTLAQRLAAELGFTLDDAATGGASDANTTAAIGVPTLDGLGPIGGDDHSADEWLDLDSVVPRTTLLAALLASAGEALG